MAALPVERTLRPGSLMTTEMKVDLPVPLRPTRPTFSPAPTTNEASRRRVRSPISMVREEPTIMGVGEFRPLRGDGSRSGAGVPGEVDDSSLPQADPGPVGGVLGSPGLRTQRREARTVARRRRVRATRRTRARRWFTMARKANW